MIMRLIGVPGDQRAQRILLRDRVRQAQGPIDEDGAALCLAQTIDPVAFTDQPLWIVYV